MKKSPQPRFPSALTTSIGSEANFIRDIQKLTIAELIELYAYAEAIVETVRQPLIILDENLRVKSVNKGFYQTFKTTAPETIGKYFFDLGNGQWESKYLRKLLEKVLPQKEIIEDYEIEHNFPLIGNRIIMLNARTVVLSGYRTQLILVAIEDITERKMIENRTEKFISMASHELRAPLTSIKVFMQLLEKKLKDGMDTKTAHIFSRVINQLNILNDLIGDLFEARKIREGTLTTKMKLQLVDPVVKKAISTFKDTTDSHQIVLNGKTKTKVNIDKERIYQVVTNLLLNAVKYSPENRNIKVSLLENEKDIIVSIEDQGIGMSAKDQKDIFTAYYAGKNTTRKTGLGLGLYISAEIIRLHRGKIWVKSKLNQGSTFSFSLPQPPTH